MTTIRSFMRHHYRHFNAAVCVDAADAWLELIASGGKMMVTLAGAMSTAELGLSLAELIRQDKVHAITCTGANLEEDVFNLIAHNEYLRLPHYRSLTPEDEQDLLERGYNRVTDTCIPEERAVRRLEKHLLAVWQKAEREGKRLLPHEALYQLLASGELEQYYQIDPKDSWLLAAQQKNLPIFVPGWEDSTTANIFVGHVIRGDLKSCQLIKSGAEQMEVLVGWYREMCQQCGIGFFQIGGGISGDFPICVVPLLHQDLKEKVPLWSYFCQISDSTTSYGSYSGAVPNEKITWGKLDSSTPRFVIESDATIVAPLIFQYILDPA